MKSKTLLILIVVIVVIIFAAIYVYRHYIEFDNKEVKKLIDDQSKKYPGQEPIAYEIIHESCLDILDDRHRLKKVRAYSKGTNIPAERVLVDTAIAVAKSEQYLSANI